MRLPSKTKNTIWVRTGGFLIINVTTDVEEYGDVAHFLYKDQIRYLQTRGLWPAGFASGDRSDTHREAVEVGPLTLPLTQHNPIPNAA